MAAPASDRASDPDLDLVGVRRDAAAAARTLVQALQRRLGARLVETHISWVLLTPERAWKIKKPVRLPFLDFATLAARKRWCDEELRLNRRLAPEVYETVEPVTGTPAAPVLGPHGAPIEYAVRMKRFADGSLLSERLAAGTLEPVLVDRLAARLAAFHAAAPHAAPHDGYGTPARIEADMRRVLDGLAAHGTDAGALALLRRTTAAGAAELQASWQARLAGGFVREGHGDLHLANTVVVGDDVTAFDCIEFDPALRWIDVQSDIAFVAMDLLAHGRAELAWRFLDRYLAASGDYGGVATLRSYVVYRALVRALVATLKPAPSGPDYLGVALAQTAPAPARLLVTHGVSGSGKSWLTARLLEASGAIRIRSDVERKRLHGFPPLAPSGSVVAGGIYGAASSARTYARLRGISAGLLRAGWSVIVDATFLRAAERAAFRELARAAGVPFTILACRAAPDVLHARIGERAGTGGDPSEADAAVLAAQQQSAEPLGADELAQAIVVDTGGSVDAAALALRWAAAA